MDTSGATTKTFRTVHVPAGVEIEALMSRTTSVLSGEAFALQVLHAVERCVDREPLYACAHGLW